MAAVAVLKESVSVTATFEAVLKEVTGATAAVSAALEFGQRLHDERASGQLSLMGALDETEGVQLRPRRLPDAKP